MIDGRSARGWRRRVNATAQVLIAPTPGTVYLPHSINALASSRSHGLPGELLAAEANEEAR
jgi:hypothetical protein